MLHWCKDKSLVFKHVADSLKRGGKFGFVIPVDFDDEAEFFTPADILNPGCYQSMVMNKPTIPSTEEVQQLISSNDFNTLSSEKKVVIWRFADVHELIEFYMTHYKGLSDKSHFNIDVMIKRYGEGEIAFEMNVLMVVAEKI